MTSITSPTDFFDKHAALLQGALGAIERRDYWNAFVEMPSEKAYGEGARASGEAAFRAHLERRFSLELPGTIGHAGVERSPYGLPLKIEYPITDIDQTLTAASRAQQAWTLIPITKRVGIALEIIARLNERSFEIAYASMHTSGHAFMMAFQAGAVHAQERALEAVAYTYREMTRAPGEVQWVKPQGKGDPLVIAKQFHVVGRGISLAIGCSTFPTWNSYPGMFASFVAGNAVVVKPHPSAVLPLAITVQVMREVLAGAGCDPDTALLVVDTPDAPAAKRLASHPDVRLIDFTGGPEFGTWLEQNLPHAHVFTEKAGVNMVMVHGTHDYQGMLRNLATTLCLYSGQMCTTPQDILVPAEGIDTDAGMVSYVGFCDDLRAAIEKMTADPLRAAELLGAIQSPATLERLEVAARLKPAIVASRKLVHPEYPEAQFRTPLLLAASEEDGEMISEEIFGPVAFVVQCSNAQAAMMLATEVTRQKGAITWSIYARDEQFIERAVAAAAEAGVHVGINFTGPLLINQSAAYSDFHVSGYNPAGNASITDPAFVLPRFRTIQVRRYA